MEDHNITSPNTVGTSKADINPAIAECKFTVEKITFRYRNSFPAYLLSPSRY